MNGEKIAFVVESGVNHVVTGKRVGTARIYTGSEERAKFHADAKPGATYRPIPYSQLPAKARENLERAAAEQ